MKKVRHVRHVRQKLTFLSLRPALKGSPLNPLTPRYARCPTLHAVRLKYASPHHPIKAPYQPLTDASVFSGLTLLRVADMMLVRQTLWKPMRWRMRCGER